MSTPTALQASRSRFMHWGRENAQFLAVGLAFVGSILYAGGKYQQLQHQRELLELGIHDQRELLEKGINDQREIFEAKLEAARAQAIQQCNEKFLLYGYAAEYKAFQQKTLGERAPIDITEKK